MFWGRGLAPPKTLSPMERDNLAHILPPRGMRPLALTPPGKNPTGAQD